MTATPISGVRNETFQVVENLWDSIAREGAESPVPDGTRDELCRRKERYSQHPASGRSWEQVK